MSELQRILVAETEGLAPGQPIPKVRWPAIAALCGPAEVAEMHERVARLRTELAAVEEWDGDTRDDIHIAIQFFRQLIALSAT